MSSKLGALADRLKKSIEAAEEDRVRREEEKRAAAEHLERTRTEAQQARTAMMAELDAFVRAVGKLEVKKSKGAIQVAYEGRKLTLEPEGDLDVIAIAKAGETGRNHHVTRDAVGEWEVVLDEDTGLRRLPLEMGLEEVLRGLLGLGAAPAAPAPAPEPVAPAKAASKPAAKADPKPKTASKAPTSEKATPAGGPGSAVKGLSNPWD